MILYPNVGAMLLAGIVQEAVAGAFIKLYSAIAQPLSPSTVKTDFTEADFSGYEAAEITAWFAPYIDPAGGATIQSGTFQFAYVAPMADPVSNTILGWWLEDADGNLIECGNFPAPITMTRNGDAIPVDLLLNYGRTAA